MKGTKYSRNVGQLQKVSHISKRNIKWRSVGKKNAQTYRRILQESI